MPKMKTFQMKTFLFLLTLMTAPFVQAEDMQKYLSDTDELARAGKYKEALERHIWFHDHALEHQPSMYGVRLSFALSSWKEMGAQYPKAIEALVEIRDRKMKSLLDGKESHELFHDVASINEVLEQPEKTVSLFEQLDEKQPKAAKGYWNVAKDAVIDAKRYDLARKYIGNPAREFTRVKAMYDHNTSLYDDPRIGGDSFKAFNENNLVEESLRLIEVANALGDKQASLEIQAKALALVQDARLRDAIPAGQNQEAQQDGTGQPSATPESKSEGGDKPQPDAEGRSR
jgi:tetratricopeptide (TPR) repeat protein